MQTTSLFPHEIVNQFISEHPIPDILKLDFQSETLLGSEELISLCCKILDFVENNAIYNVYHLDAPAFQHIFTQLSKFYLSDQSSDIKFELLKSEKTIHLLTQIHATQDISAYLRLTEEFCLDERISELVHLLYSKHSLWYDGYSEVYTEWTCLLVPYLEYLRTINFKLVKLLDPKATLKQDFIQEKCIYLKHLLAEKKLQIEVDITRLSDYSYLAEKAGEFKKLLSENALHKDGDFYYELGLCAFICHYANYQGKEDHTLIRLCLLSALYLEKAKDLEKSKSASELNIFDFKPSVVDKENWEELAGDFGQILLKQPSISVEQAGVLDCLFSVFRIKKIEHWTVFKSALYKIDSDIIGRESRTFDLSNMLYTFLSLLESMGNQFLDSDFFRFKIQLGPMINQLNPLKSALQDKYYHITRYLTENNAPGWKLAAMDDYILNGPPLRVSIYCSENLRKDADLIFNLRHSLALLNNNLASIDQRSSGELLSIVKAFVRVSSGKGIQLSRPSLFNAVKQLIQNFTQKSLEREKNKALKLIGAYVSGMLSWDILPVVGPFVKVQSEFVKNYFPVMFKNNEQNIWELFTIQQHLWGLLDKIPYDPEIINEKWLRELFKAYEDHMAVAQISCKTLQSRFAQVDSIVFSILADSIDKFTELSQCIVQYIADMKVTSSAIDMERINCLIKEARKFIYFTLNWVEYFVKALGENKTQIPWPLAKKLLRKTFNLYFDPAFVFFIEPSERKLFQTAFSSIIQKSKALELSARTALCRTIQDTLVLINNKILSDSKEFSRLISVTRSLDDFSVLQEKLLTNKDFSSKSIIWLSFLVGFEKLKDSLQEYILCTVHENEQENELLESLEKVVFALKELILQLDNLFSPSNIETNDLNEIFSKDNNFLARFSTGIEAFLKPFHSFGKNNHFLADFVCDLLIKSLRNDHQEWRGISFGVVTDLIEHYNSEKVYTLMYTDKGLMIFLLREVSGFVSKEVQQKYPFSQYNQKQPIKLSYISKFMQQLSKSFEFELEWRKATNIRSILAPNNAELEFEQAFANWLIQLMKDIKSSFGFETILLNNSTVINILVDFLKIFEAGYCYLNKETQDTDTAVQALKRTLDRKKNPPWQEGEIGFGTLFGGEGEDDFIAFDEQPVTQSNDEDLLKEISDLEHKIENEEKFLSNKKGIIEPVGDELAKGLDSLIFYHSFESVAKNINTTALSPSKKSAIANLICLINTLNKKAIDEVDTQLFKLEECYQSKDLIEYQGMDNKVYNKLYTLQTYLETLTKALVVQHSTHIDESFIFGIYHSSMIIMSQITDVTNEELLSLIANKLQSVIDILSKFLKTYVSEAYLHKNMTQETSLSLSKWFKQVFEIHIHLQNTIKFHLIQPERKEFIAFMGLFQLATYIEPDSMALILLSQNCILENLLCQEVKNPWDTSLVHSLTCALDAFVGSHLPYSFAVESTIKKLIISRKRKEDLLNLETLKKNLFIDKLSEQDLETLVATLFNKFNIIPKQNLELLGDFFERATAVCIKMDQESKTPLYKIEEILRQIPLDLCRIMDTLMRCLIDNYLHNMVIISNTPKRREFDGKKFRETSGIINILSNIMLNCEDLIIYAVFNKHDYSVQVCKYVKQIEFLREEDIDSHKSIAFMDCLFKLKYFIFNGQDGVVLTRALMTHTGTTFISPDDPEQALDVSCLVINRIIDCMTRELEADKESKSFSLIEGHIKLYETLLVHGSCLIHAKQNCEITMFDKYVKSGFLRLLRNIMCCIKDFVKDNYSSLSTYTLIDLMLLERVSQDYQSLHLDSREIDSLKIENYKALLDDSELQKKLLTHNELNSMFENVEADLVKVEKTSTACFPEGLGLLKEKRKAVINCHNTEYNRSKVCVDKDTLIYIKDNWKKRVDKLIGMAGSMTGYPQKLYNKGEKMRIQNLASYWEAIKSSLETPREAYNVLPPSMPICFFKDSQDQNKTNQTSSQRLETYKTLVYNKLKQQYHEETKKQVSIQTENIQEESKQEVQVPAETETIPKETVISQPEQTAVDEIPPEEKKIKYFYHPTLATYDDFLYIKNKVSARLKILCEKVLFSLYHTEVTGTSSDTTKKDIATHEVAEELQMLPSFEQNVMLCLIGMFKDLQAFEYPENFNEIRNEYNMIEDDFSKYLDLLNAQRRSNLEVPPTEQKKDKENVEFSNIFHDGFVFSIEDPPPVSQEDNYTKKFLENEAKLIREFCFIDDEVVESLISVFYLDYHGRMSSADNYICSLLEQLCTSPLFEVKLFDFFMFFLHCPHHTTSLPKSSKGFPYTNIFNKSQDTSVYNVVALNILDFLSSIVAKKDYIFYQPRTFLEQHGLKNLRKLKTQFNYMEKTSEMVSIADLIIGALAIPEISAELALSDELTILINNIFENPKDFEPLEVKVGEELIEKPRVLSLRSCHAILRLDNYTKIMKSVPQIILSCPKSIIKNLLLTIESFYFTIEETNVQLKKKITETPDEVILNDIDPLILLTPGLESFQKTLEAVSSCICNWVVQKVRPSDSKPAKKPKHLLFKEGLQQFTIKVINEKMVEDFVIHIMESLTYIVTSKLNEDYNGPLPLCLAKICTNLYALLCSEGISHHQSEREQMVNSSGDIALPKLSKIVSRDPFPELSNIPELSKTFSYLRNERKFDFDMLYTNLWRKHPELLRELIYKEDEKINNEIYVISKRLPFIIDFKTKQTMLKDTISKDQQRIGVYDDERNISIDRSDIVRTTLKELKSSTSTELKTPVNVRFKNEYGIDGGGPRKEWLTLVTKELFNPMNGLFKLSENGNSVLPNPASKIIPSHLSYFELAGIIVAKAIENECAIDVTFTKSVLKHILKREIALSDLEDIDLEYTKSLRWMLENPVDELEQSFTYEAQFFNHYLTKDLLPNGSDVIVTESNKKEFIKRVCEMRMKEEVQEELEAFLKGFHMIISHTFLDLFTVSDLQLLIGGNTTVDLADMKKNTNYYSYNESDNLIIWLWEILESFTEKELSAFVFFISGSFRLPANVFHNKPFRVRQAYSSSTSLPIAHTCYLEIEIPLYTSKEALQQKLLLAIFEGQQGYQFG